MSVMLIVFLLKGKAIIKMKKMMTSSYGDDKFSKAVELNEDMSVVPQAPDEYEMAVKKGH